MPDDYRFESPDDEHPIDHAPWPPPPARRRGGLLPVLLALVVIGLGAATVFFVWPRLKPRPTAQTSSAPPSAAPAAPTADRRGPLPALDDSDTFVRSLAAGLSAHPELARWLGRTALVRTLTSVVANIAEGESPRHDLEFLAPKQRFKARGKAGRVVADPAAYAGYDVFADAIASIDAAAAASAYHATEPLFDAAYRDLGHPGGFRPGLDAAIQELLAAPVPPADTELVASAGGFRWANPELEKLSLAQKQLLRMGPRNVRLVRAKLRELRSELDPAPSR